MGAHDRAGHPGSHGGGRGPVAARPAAPHPAAAAGAPAAGGAAVRPAQRALRRPSRARSPVFNLHNTFRWALVPGRVRRRCSGSTRSRCTRPRPAGTGDLRPATGWTFFGSGSRDATAAAGFAAEVVAELRRRAAWRASRWAWTGSRPAGHLALARRRRTRRGRAAARWSGRARSRPRTSSPRCAPTPRDLRPGDRAACARCSRPGVTENELWAALVGSAFAARAPSGARPGCCRRDRGRTRGCRRPPTGVVRDGDLVAFDTDLVGRHGYLTDVSRTYLCGDRPPAASSAGSTGSHDFLHTCLPELRPGASFAELGPGCAAGARGVPCAALRSPHRARDPAGRRAPARRLRHGRSSSPTSSLRRAVGVHEEQDGGHARRARAAIRGVRYGARLPADAVRSPVPPATCLPAGHMGP